MPPGEELPAVAKVLGGGSLMLAWQVNGKNILVVGGGEVAAGRILHCLNADAVVTMVCPQSGLCPELVRRVADGQVTHLDRLFDPKDLEPEAPVAMVLTAIDDVVLSSAICQLCRERRIPVNVADIPSQCDFYFGSIHRDGPVQIMVSTNGQGPRLAAQIRRFIARQLLDSSVGNAAEVLGQLRVRLRAQMPMLVDGPYRMAWMSNVSDQYSWHDLATFSFEDIDNLLLLYLYSPSGLPSIEELRALRKEPGEVFDGSFGFCIGA